ncbi:hypothetical protein CF15_05765 [Pyrodictium occultum]|uniref:Uncharacterized protein n=1 Tax=Pyrodictium occultum TaxID=2309 RepID=A0A0V8RW40_PYROC|nr:hypothetical protein CF15_05765 [Pyrodictium occultum]
MLVVCSVNVYVDATGPAPIASYEATCSILYVCGEVRVEPAESAEVEVLGDTGCFVARNRGGRMSLRLEYRSLPETIPSRPALPQPYPPFSVVDAFVVVDSRPGLELYGLPFRRSAVVTLTQRTLLEGRSPLQLVVVDEALDELHGLSTRLGPLETLYPVLSGDEQVDGIKLCEAARGYGLQVWGECVNKLGGVRVSPYLQLLRSTRARRPVFEAVAARLYAGTAVNSLLDPAELARKLYDMGLDTPVWARRSGGGLRLEGIEGIRVWLRSLVDGVEKIEGLRMGRGPAVLSGEYSEIALACRQCWEPLDFFIQQG